MEALKKDLNAWRVAQLENTIPSFGTYLEAFPDGNFATAARVAMDRLGGEYELHGIYLLDKRDGQHYKTLKFVGKTWMVENLNFNVAGSYFYGEEKNCEQFGRLYTWEAALKACPKGWHLPTEEDWRKMAKQFGGADDAIDKGKAAYEALMDGGSSGCASWWLALRRR